MPGRWRMSCRGKSLIVSRESLIDECAEAVQILNVKLAHRIGSLDQLGLPALRSDSMQILPAVRAFIIFIKLLASRMKAKSADYANVYVFLKHES
jgi:hypothetical protein